MLKRQQIEEFFEVGFVRVPAVFTRSEVHDMRLAFERLERMAYALGESGMHQGAQFVLSNGGNRPVRIQRIVWCGAAEPILSHYGRDSRLLKMSAMLLGSREMNQLINQAHFKMPGDGVEFPWHQDSTHRRFGRSEWKDVNGKGSYVQTVTAIDEVTEHNGPLELIPGSCRHGHLGLSREGTLPPGLLEGEHTVRGTMSPGDVLLFGPYTLHRSRPNRSGYPRRVFINGFAFPGANTRVYPGEGAGRLVRLM